jgi:putative sporulation protein YyaC
MFRINLPSSADRERKYKYHMDDSQGIIHLTDCLAHYMTNRGNKQEIVALCIGTDRSTGDCLGPLVGSRLKEISGPDLIVYGTLEYPVHASNLQATMAELNTLYPNSFVLAIDACLGKLDSVGFISLSKGALKPGAGVHKNLPLVGEVHLTGVVNVGGFMEYLVLQNTRLNMVMKMAREISNVVINAHSIAINIKHKGSL